MRRLTRFRRLRRLLPRSAGRFRSRPLLGRPGGHAESPQPNETLGVFVTEGVRGVVGGQTVVVERDRATASDDGAGAGGGEAQANITGDVTLRGGDEGVQGRLQRREPQAVVDQLGPAGLEPGLLMMQVTLEGQVFEVGVRDDERQGGWAFVDLTALDADPAVLHHVQPTEATAAGDAAQLGDQAAQATATRRPAKRARRTRNR